MLVLARNNAGTPEKFSTKQLSLFFAGDGLTSGEITILTNAAETYMDSNGKGVIS